MQYRESKPIESINQSELFIKKVLEDISENKKYRYAIIEKQSNALIGNFIYTLVGTQVCKIGCSFEKKHWNKGYASELIKELI